MPITSIRSGMALTSKQQLPVLVQRLRNALSLLPAVEFAGLWFFRTARFTADRSKHHYPTVQADQKLSALMAAWLQPQTCPFEWNHHTIFILSCLPDFRVYGLMSWRGTFPWWNQSVQGQLWSLHVFCPAKGFCKQQPWRNLVFSHDQEKVNITCPLRIL